ncbi:hypothetical protein I0C86_40545 [Plantactinospora sp. S1510]|uniref:Uncharacterized protein n=1 Tax=Plantactinospora alkalitolerans TaxID=2789879 RepID=A0ABS0H9L9_9ACTN|nr:hypothetical protein [Plantactinospora alkalitolerans]MBF9135171.1 hypothetical protein [Plantactinospora alkalitolerans]
MSEVRIERPDDERIEVYVGDRLVASANHDQHGWSGMEAVEATAVAVADAFVPTPAGCEPVTSPDGSALFIHVGSGGYRCDNTEWWNERVSGPINVQGCDACDSGGGGSWRPLYVRVETR